MKGKNKCKYIDNNIIIILLLTNYVYSVIMVLEPDTQEEE